ncbi:MAG TPA: molecular chaperone HtpG, partial [Gammaproteobacteria bacterium]|nr:molecular chaperone HtpG [Gammaproteobacteria bacterium]
QLLHLMVHSLYSNREIFLRELISNASDANDKLRFEALARPELLEGGGELAITVEIDPESRHLSVSDNGIGMSRDEIITHLGTIAHSGTARFLEGLTGDQREDAQLIGRFGVGFYSAFIVAEQVEVLSRAAGLPAEEGVRWVSDGQGEYTVELCEKPERGTSVRLTLKEDAAEFLERYRIEALIRKYSDHIAFPVRLEKSGEKAGAESVNQAKALWTRPRAEIEDREYLELYRHITHDQAEPLAWTHNKVEGKREFTCLLYIPSAAPFDLWNREAPRGIKLYIRRVFITDDATDFLPLYLRFVRGIVDAGDLSLNVSREMLQQDANVAAIKSALTKRVLDMLARLAKDEPAKYETFWRELGEVFKEGIAEDPANRESLAELLRFSSTRSKGDAEDRSLAAYAEAVKPGQESIYYLRADSLGAARSSPHLEVLKERDVEVLLLTGRLDEWLIPQLHEYRGKPLTDVARGELDLGKLGAEPRVETELGKDEKDVLKRVKRVLRDRVDEVRFSARLNESAACLAIGEQDLGYQMRELFKAAGQEAPETRPSLELNPRHPLVKQLGRGRDELRFERLAHVLLDQATLAEGRQLDDPAGFVKRLNALLVETEEREGKAQEAS